MFKTILKDLAGAPTMAVGAIVFGIFVLLGLLKELVFLEPRAVFGIAFTLLFVWALGKTYKAVVKRLL